MGKIRYIVGNCEVDIENETVYRNGRLVQLSELPWKLLATLLTSYNYDAPYSEITHEMWEYDKDYDEHTSKSIKPHVTKLREALGISIKNYGRGYSIEDPVTIRRISGLSPRLASCSDFFYGRDALLEKIRSTLEEKGNTVFLVGMGGIGKSEVAKHYAKKYGDCYDTVVFARYETSLAALIADDSIFSIDGVSRITKPDGEMQSDDEYARVKIGVLKQYTDCKTLIIIDNFDAETPDPLLPVLAEYNKYHLVFTSRYDQDKKYTQLPVGEIEDDKELAQLVISNCVGFTTPEPDDEDFPELFEFTKRHTLTLELMARYMAEYSLTIRQLLDTLSENGIKGIGEVKVIHGDKSAEVVDFLKELFKISRLSREEVTIMQYLYLVPSSGVPQRLFAEWSGRIFNFCAAGLIRKKWICYDRETNTLFLHPIISEVVGIECAPTWQSCEPFLVEFVKEAHDVGSFNHSREKKQICSLIAKRLFRVLGINEDTFDFLYEISKLIVHTCDTPAEAIEYKTSLYDFARTHYGEDSLSACKVAIQTANNYLVCGDFEKAYEWQYERAYKILEKMTERTNEYWIEREKSADQMGYIHLRNYKFNGGLRDTDLPTAEKYFFDGIAATEKMTVTEELPQHFIDYKAAYATLGLCRLYAECDEAEKLSKAIERVGELYRSSLENRVNIATDICILNAMKGRLLYLCGSFEEAVRVLEKSLADKKEMSTISTTTDMEILMYIADCYAALGNAELEEQYVSKALLIAENNFSEKSAWVGLLRKRLSGMGLSGQ